MQSLPKVDVPSVATVAEKSTAAVAPSRRLYASGANRRHQLKSTDLIPKRVRACVLTILMLSGILGLLNYLAVNANGWRAIIGDEGVATLALTGKGTLASWFCSALFILAAMTSCQIFWLRKHRCDDYRGSYRVWSWLAAVFLIASIGCTANIGGLVHRLVGYLFGESLTSGGLPPIAALAWIVLAAMAIRLMFEVKVSRSALGLVLVAWFAYSCRIAATLPAVNEKLAEQASLPIEVGLIIGNASLIGAMAVLLAATTYARCIYLLAHGLIKPRVSKAKPVKAKMAKRKPVAGKKTSAAKTAAKSASPKTSTSKASSAKSGSTRRSKSSVSSSNAAKSGTTKPKPTDVAATPASKSSSRPVNKQAGETADVGAFDDIQPVISMSKAERRRKRKLEKRQRRAA